MTVAERDLLEHGDAGLVRQIRLRVQENNQTNFEGAIERITGRRVLAYQSQVLFDPDYTIEIFVLSGRLHEVSSATCQGGSCEAGAAGALNRTVGRLRRPPMAASGETDLTQEGSSVSTDSAPLSGDPLVGGHLSAAICNAVVRIQREFLGRGPTTARASVRGDIVVVLMQDTLTKAERSLAADGNRRMCCEAGGACRARCATTSWLRWRSSRAAR